MWCDPCVRLMVVSWRLWGWGEQLGLCFCVCVLACLDYVAGWTHMPQEIEPRDQGSPLDKAAWGISFHLAKGNHFIFSFVSWKHLENNFQSHANMKPIRYKWSTKAFSSEFTVSNSFLQRRGFSKVFYYCLILFWEYSSLFITLCPFSHFSLLNHVSLTSYYLATELTVLLFKDSAKLTQSQQQNVKIPFSWHAPSMGAI